MKNIYTRPFNGASSQEVELFKESFKANDAELGPEVLYPDTKFIVAESDQPLLFVPVQSVYMMGSLGHKDVPPLQLATAMRQVVATLVWESRKQGRGDIYFVGGNEHSDTFAENNGFERVDKPVFRMRLK